MSARDLTLQANLDAALEQIKVLEGALDRLDYISKDSDMEWVCRDLPKRIAELKLAKLRAMSDLLAAKQAKVRFL